MTPNLDQLRATIARIERHSPSTASATLPFGIPEIDAALPGGGLATAALHEVTGSGIDIEFAAAPALFAAGILARRPGPVLWVLHRPDLFPPALAAAGLHPARVIYVQAGTEALLVMEEALNHPGLAGVVAEITAPVSLTVSRRLHLAAQAGGALALLLRRRTQPEGALAAMTRWRIGPQPSAPHPARPPHSRSRPDAVAAGTDALPRRTHGILDNGGLRCVGSSRFGSPIGLRIGYGAA